MTTKMVSTYGEILIGGSAIYHLIVGIFSMLSIGRTRMLAKKLYSLNLPEHLDPRYEYLLKPLGGYAVFVSALCFHALYGRESAFSEFLLWALAALYFSRAIQRLIFRELFSRAFEISFRRSLMNVVFNLILALSIALFGFSH